MMEKNMFNLKIFQNTLMLRKNFLKKNLHINVIALKKKLTNKKKNVKNKVSHMFIIENGEMLKIFKFQKM